MWGHACGVSIPTTASGGSVSGADKRAFLQPRLLELQPTLPPFTAEGLLQLFTHNVLNSWLFARGKVLRPGFDWRSGRWHLAASRVTFPELPSQNYLRRGLWLRLHWLQLWPCDGWWLPGSWPLSPPLCACSWTFNQFHTISAVFLQEEPHLRLIYPVTPGPQ